MTVRLQVFLVLFCALFTLSGCNDTAAPLTPDFNVEEATIANIHAQMQKGELTAEILVNEYLKRIEQFDQTTHLNAIVVINEMALAEARALDNEFAKTGKLLPLHGIPVIVKDNYDTAGIQTSGGSIALKGVIPPDDAFQIKRLKAAGAIVLAKSNMAEWAFSPSGTLSSIGGLTRNPYDLSRVPAGSSGGTGAAIAASFGSVGLGTDTGNSIRGPSSHNALVGIRSSMGLTSRDGIIPLYLRNDIGGPMARTVEDAVRVFNVIAGYDPADPITSLSKGKRPISYLDALDRQGLQGKRIGVMRHYTDTAAIDPEINHLFTQAVSDLALQGAKIVDPFNIPNFASLIKDNWCNTFVADANNYLASLGDRAPYKTIQDVYDADLYSVPLKKSLEYMLKTAQNPPACADLYTQPRNKAFREAVLAAMDTAQVDLLVYPTWSFPPREIADKEGHKGDNSQHISPHTGLPSITVPMGYSRNGKLPAGLSFVGRLFAEPELFAASYAYEQGTLHRKAPLALATASSSSKE